MMGLLPLSKDPLVPQAVPVHLAILPLNRLPFG